MKKNLSFAKIISIFAIFTLINTSSAFACSPPYREPGYVEPRPSVIDMLLTAKFVDQATCSSFGTNLTLLSRGILIALAIALFFSFRHFKKKIIGNAIRRIILTFHIIFIALLLVLALLPLDLDSLYYLFF